MRSNSSLLGIWHLFARLISNQQRYFPLAGSSFILLLRNSHLFHVKTHTYLCLIFDSFKYEFLYFIYFGDSLIFLVLGIQMKIFNCHGTDCLAVECFYIFYLLCYPSTLHY